jgi:hypothetical protein
LIEQEKQEVKDQLRQVGSKLFYRMKNSTLITALSISITFYVFPVLHTVAFLLPSIFKGFCPFV